MQLPFQAPRHTPRAKDRDCRGAQPPGQPQARLSRKRSRECPDLDAHEAALLSAAARAVPACREAGFTQQEACLWFSETIAHVVCSTWTTGEAVYDSSL